METIGWTFDNVNGESFTPLQSVTVSAGDTRLLTYQNSQVIAVSNAIGVRYDPIYPIGIGVGSLEYGAPVRTDPSVANEIAGSSSFDTFAP